MRESSAMLDHFLVKVKITFRISTEWRRKNQYTDILKTTKAKVYQEKITLELRKIRKMANINEA